MNIQTERLENHTARLTVELEPAAIDQAKHKAARKLSNRVNLPGFRKGKAPYHIVVRYIGEAAIVEEAVELISNDLYPEALRESGVEPYGPGSVEDFTLEPPAIVFVVPLAATVDLQNYRLVRLPYEPRAISDKEVESGLRRLQERHAVIEPTDQPAALGNQVTLDIHSHIHEEGESGHEGKDFIHEHSFKFVLDEADDLLPGFSPKLVGANKGDKLDFELTIPEDSEDFPEDRGKTVHFEVGVSDITNITLPVLNDEFAARVTADVARDDDTEETSLTLLQLRIRVREDLEQAATNETQSRYAEQMLNAIVEQADIRYPEAMIVDQVESMLERMDQQLRQQGMNLGDYKRLLNKTDEDLFNDYRDSAIGILRRGLARRELFEREQLEPTLADFDAEVERLVGTGTDEQKDSVRAMFESGPMGDYLREQMAERKLRERLVAIGTGEAPELPTPTPAAEEPAATVSEPEEETT